MVLEITNMACKDWFHLRARRLQEERLSHQIKGKRPNIRLFRMDRGEKSVLGRFVLGSTYFS